MLVGNQQFEFVSGAGLLVDLAFEFLQRTFDLCGLVSVF